MELIIINIGLKAGVIAKQLFSILVVMEMLFPKNAKPESSIVATLRGIIASTKAWCAYPCMAPLLVGTGFNMETVLCKHMGVGVRGREKRVLVS